MLRWNKIKLKHLKIGLYGIAAFAIIALATSSRMLLIYQGWPQTNSDESTMGLMALHIAYRGEYPIYFYGQSYMGSLEAYLGAAFFHLFGPSVFALRLGVMLMFTVFLASMYLLISLLYTQKIALVVLVLLSLGSSNILFLEMLAAGGYPEILLFGSLLLLVASWLALSYSPDASTARRKWRTLVYGCWGVLVGVAIWSDLLILPFVFMAGLLLVPCCRDELRRGTVVALILGLAIGLSPPIIYNATLPPGVHLPWIFEILFTYDVAGHISSQPSLAQKLAGTFLVALPKVTGASALCPPSSQAIWPLSVQSSARTMQCTIIQASWGLGFLVLWAVATFLAARAFWRLRPWPRPSADSWSYKKRQSAIRHFARLMLLGSAGLTLLVFAISAPAALSPLTSSRYLLGLLVAIPAVIWPLWSGISTLKPPLARFATVKMVFRYAVLLLIGTAFLLGTVNTVSAIAGAQAANQQQDALIHDLLHIRARHIYSDYWSCNRIIFGSREQIICSVLDEHLQPGFDRYLRYRSIVRADPHAAYVFPVSSPQVDAVVQKVASAGGRYLFFVFDDYVIYEPG